MNEQFRRPDLTMTTTAAEGLARRRWTVTEIEAMTPPDLTTRTPP
jgi:hypothetical protein